MNIDHKDFLENFENSIEASKIEVEDMEGAMVSNDSIFNHLNPNKNEFLRKDDSKRSMKPQRMRKSK